MSNNTPAPASGRMIGEDGKTRNIVTMLGGEPVSDEKHNISTRMPRTGRVERVDGEIVNLVDILNALGSCEPVSDDKYDINVYAAMSDLLIGEDWRAYSYTDMLRKLVAEAGTGGTGDTGGDQPDAQRAMRISDNIMMALLGDGVSGEQSGLLRRVAADLLDAQRIMRISDNVEVFLQ